MTILLRPDLIPTKAPMLTLVMAQSVAEGIREVTGMETWNQMAERYCYE